MYRSPAPLHTELQFRCDLNRQEGRKIFADGRVFAGDTLCAEAEAIFISARPEVFEKLLAARKRMEAQRDP